MGNRTPYIKVLWIDDESLTEGKETILFAKSEEIIIDPVDNVDAGIKLLQDESLHYDAVILDIKSNMTGNKDEVADMKALAYANDRISKLRKYIPCFIYTGFGELWEGLINYTISSDNLCIKPHLYHKPKDLELLLEDIKKEVALSEEYKIRLDFADAFGVIQDVTLLDIIKVFKSENRDKDPEFPKKVRGALEEIAIFFKDNELIEFRQDKSYHSKELSLYLGQKDRSFTGEKFGNKLVPSYIQRCVHLLHECTNEDSHHHDSDVAPFKIPKHIANGSAIYLNRIIFFSLMQVLAWCKSLPLDDERWRKEWKEYFNRIKSAK